MANVDFYETLFKSMLDRDKPRDEMFVEMNNMWMSIWDSPLDDEDWFHKVVSTDPHDAIRSGTRVLSSSEPRIKLQPLGPAIEDRKNVDRIERALYWHFLNAARRRRVNTVADLVMSALLYDEIVAQVVYLPHQIEQAEALGQDTKRLTAALRYGLFSVIVRNPQDVHVTYSDYMPEEVLMEKVMTVEEVVQFWGEKNTKKLIKDPDNLKDNDGSPFVTIYDYTNLDERVVMASLQERETRVSEPDDLVEIINEEHKLPFLPWVARVGGTNIFDSGVAQRIPMLWSVHMSNQYNTQNIAESLMVSEAIAYSASPRLKISGPTNNIDIAYGEPGRAAWVPPGHDLTELRPPIIDTNLLAIADRIGGRMAKSTIPRVLQTGDIPSGTPFSALNLITQSGLKSLVPYKYLSENAMADVFRTMLYWIDHSGDDVTAYVPTRGTDDNLYTQQLSIKKGDFDVDHIYMTVELAEDVPTDRLSRIQGAQTLMQMGWSKYDLAEDLGETDPGALVERSRQERQEDMDEQIELEKKKMAELGDAGRIEMAKNYRLQVALQMEAQQKAQQGQQQQNGQQNGQNLSGQMRNQQVQQAASQRRGVASGAAGGAVAAQADPQSNQRERTFTGEDNG